MKSSLHKAAKFSGVFFTFLSFLYLAHILWEKWEYIINLPGSKKLLLFIAPSGVIYGLTCILLAFAWHHMLAMIDHSIKFSTTYPIYARSQIGKYLPGNIIHYAGRQVMGKAAGVGHNVLLTATTCETLLLITASIGITVAGLPTLNIGQSYKNLIVIVGISVTVCIFLSVLLFSSLSVRFPSLSKYFGNLPNFHFKDWISFIFTPLTTYVFFFLLIGTILSAIALLSFPLGFSIKQVVIFCSLYAASWTLGFITPGCPGGIGVRDAALTAGLMPFIGTPHALSLALALRVVTVLGDVVFYLTSYIKSK